MADSRKDYTDFKQLAIGLFIGGSLFFLSGIWMAFDLSLCVDGCEDDTWTFLVLFGAIFWFVSFITYSKYVRNSPWKKIIEEEKKELAIKMAKYDKGPNGYLFFFIVIIVFFILFFLSEYLEN